MLAARRLPARPEDAPQRRRPRECRRLPGGPPTAPARWLLAWSLAACAPPLAPSPVGPAAPLQLNEGTMVAYVLAWSWEGARREGDAYVFTTDRGYTVGIRSAALATARVELVPCEERGDAASRQRSASRDTMSTFDPASSVAATTPDAAPDLRDPTASAAASALDAALDLLVPTAHAAHARIGDGSAVADPVIESLLVPEPLLYGRGFAGPRPYCGVHLLAAPTAGESADGAALARESLALTGYWSAPGSAERHELRARINLQDGSLRPLLGWTRWPAAVQPGRAPVAVIIQRRPARAFDGLELARLSELDLGFAVLGNLLQGAQVEVASAAAEP